VLWLWVGGIALMVGGMMAWWPHANRSVNRLEGEAL
jgi:hypothetical protein